MERRRGLKIGDKAPDFGLKDHNDKEFYLFDFRGKRVLLSFHPLAWTSVCAKQMQSLEANKERFDELNTSAVGLSVDAVPTKKAWAKDLEIKETRLLSDFWPHGQVAKLYSIFREGEGFSERANIIVCEEGEVDFVKIYKIPQLPDIEEIIDFLKG